MQKLEREKKLLKSLRFCISIHKKRDCYMIKFYDSEYKPRT